MAEQEGAIPGPETQEADRQVYDPGFPAAAPRFRPLSAPRTYQGRSSHIRLSTGAAIRSPRDPHVHGSDDERAVRPARCASAPEKARSFVSMEGHLRSNGVFMLPNRRNEQLGSYDMDSAALGLIGESFRSNSPHELGLPAEKSRGRRPVLDSTLCCARACLIVSPYARTPPSRAVSSGA